MTDIEQLRKNLEGIHVLYVEDEDYVREVTLDFLEEIFSHVDSACNGQEGLELFKKGAYQLVISDLKMPKMGGREMLEKIRAINDRTALMAMTASDSDEDASQTVSDAFMRKPVELVEFLETLESIQEKILTA